MAASLKTGKQLQLSHLRALISGSSALSTRLKEAYQTLNAPIIERYGMTETGMITSNSIKAGGVRGVGVAFPSVEIKAETGQIGDIFVKGPGLFSGYLKDDGFYAHPVNEFFRTGDQGFWEGNHLQLCGRDRDIFKVAGFKVSAREIEEALSEHAQVLECVVCALPHSPQDDSSQIIAALIKVPEKESIKASDFRTFLQSKLAYYKIPRKWMIVGEDFVIPRNLIGKPDISAIQSLFLVK